MFLVFFALLVQGDKNQRYAFIGHRESCQDILRLMGAQARLLFDLTTHIQAVGAFQLKFSRLIFSAKQPHLHLVGWGAINGGRKNGPTGSGWTWVCNTFVATHRNS